LPVDAADAGETTPLHLAARYDPNPEAVRLLVEAGADLERTGEYGERPLHATARLNPESAVLAELVRPGADLEARDGDGWTPSSLPLVGRCRAGPCCKRWPIWAPM